MFCSSQQVKKQKTQRNSFGSSRFENPPTHLALTQGDVPLSLRMHRDENNQKVIPSHRDIFNLSLTDCCCRQAHIISEESSHEEVVRARSDVHSCESASQRKITGRKRKCKTAKPKKKCKKRMKITIEDACDADGNLLCLDGPNQSKQPVSHDEQSASTYSGCNTDHNPSANFSREDASLMGVLSTDQHRHGLSCIEMMSKVAKKNPNQRCAQSTANNDLALGNIAVEAGAHTTYVLLKSVPHRRNNYSSRATATSGQGSWKLLQEILPEFTNDVCEASGTNKNRYARNVRDNVHIAVPHSTPVAEYFTSNKASCVYAEGYTFYLAELMKNPDLTLEGRVKVWDKFHRIEDSKCREELCQLNTLFDRARRSEETQCIQLIGGFYTTHVGIVYECDTTQSLKDNVQNFLLEVYVMAMMKEFRSMQELLNKRFKKYLSRSKLTESCLRVFGMRIRSATQLLLQTDPQKRRTSAIAAGAVLVMAITNKKTKETTLRPTMRSNLSVPGPLWHLLELKQLQNEKQWISAIDDAYRKAQRTFETQAENCIKAITNDNIRDAVVKARERGPMEVSELLSRFTELDERIVDNAKAAGITDLSRLNDSMCKTLRDEELFKTFQKNANAAGITDLSLISNKPCLVAILRDEKSFKTMLHNAALLTLVSLHPDWCTDAHYATLGSNDFTSNTIDNLEKLNNTIGLDDFQWLNKELVKTLRSKDHFSQTKKNMAELQIPICNMQRLKEKALTTLRSEKKMKKLRDSAKNTEEWVKNSTVSSNSNTRSRKARYEKSLQSSSTPNGMSHSAKKKPRRRWKDDEKQTVIKNMRDGMSCEEIHNLLLPNRSVSAIRGIWKRESNKEKKANTKT